MARASTKITSTKKEPAKRRARAKKADGTFQADDPATPDVNEAFVYSCYCLLLVFYRYIIWF